MDYFLFLFKKRYEILAFAERQHKKRSNYLWKEEMTL